MHQRIIIHLYSTINSPKWLTTDKLGPKSYLVLVEPHYNGRLWLEIMQSIWIVKKFAQHFHYMLTKTSEAIFIASISYIAIPSSW